MKRFPRSLSVLLCAGLLAACGTTDTSTDTETPVETSSSAPTVTTTTLPSTPTEEPDVDAEPVLPMSDDLAVVYDWEEPTVAATGEPTGANAAPDGSGIHTIYDSSETAKSNFHAWWNYEIQVPQDNREFNAIYEAGRIVCASRAGGAGVIAIENVLTTEMGYTPSGASGIVRASLAALCPQYDLGYRTYFDQNALKFAQALQSKITFQRVPSEMELGAFMKETCAALAAPGIGGTGIYNHIAGLTVNDYFYNLFGETVDSQVLYIFINEATKAGCTGFTTSLPPVISMSS